MDIHKAPCISLVQGFCLLCCNDSVRKRVFSENTGKMLRKTHLLPLILLALLLIQDSCIDLIDGKNHNRGIIVSGYPANESAFYKSLLSPVMV